MTKESKIIRLRKIKAFSNSISSEFQGSINNWMRSNEYVIDIIDVKLHSSESGFSAVIIYEDLTDENEVDEGRINELLPR